ncbi:MAG: hypothetical protein N2316_11795 [Spirochaetes bacterium]|nr:hypothetical protein [Spirochaetota bacterium]
MNEILSKALLSLREKIIQSLQIWDERFHAETREISHPLADVGIGKLLS